MSYQEKDFQSDFNRWKCHHMRYTCCEELKICKTDKFSFSHIASHQYANLYNAKHCFIQHKIPDLGQQNPFDSFSLCGVLAYVVILFYKPRKPKRFYVIGIDELMGFMDDNPKKKSITEEECEKICLIKDIL